MPPSPKYATNKDIFQRIFLSEKFSQKLFFIYLFF